MLLLLSSLALADCPVRQVLTPGLDITRAFGDGTIPRGSLVQPAGGQCEAGASVEVVAVNWMYNDGTGYPAVGESGCLPDDALKPVSQLFAFRLHPDSTLEPAVTPGTVVKADDVCADPAGMSNLRPITRTQLADIRKVQAAYQKLWGPIGLDAIGYTDWGYVGLPYTRRRTQLELEEARDAEKTVTDDQRGLVTGSFGPQTDLGRVYEHWPGNDPRFSDTYGHADTVITLMQIAASWYPRCVKDRTLKDANPVNCTVQFGDIAWYNPKRPDPLGHNTHYAGKCVDIRLFRSDGSRYEAWYNKPDDREGFGHAYAQALNLAFADHILKVAPSDKLYFNDPVVLAAHPQVEKVYKHDDHFHYCVPDELPAP